MEAPFPFAGEALAATSSLTWAVGALLFTRLPRTASPAALNLGKNLVGSVCFLGLLLLQGDGLPGRGASAASLGWLVLGGISGLALCDVLLFRCFREMGPRRTNIVMALSPVLVAFLAFLPPLNEHPALLAWAGMLCCIAAIVLAIRERRTPGVRAPSAVGWRDAFLAAALQAAGFVFTRLGMQDGGYTVTAGAAIRLLAGTTGLALLGLPGARLAAWVRELRPPGVARPLLLAALIGTFAGIWTNQAGIAWATLVGVAATLNALTPVWLVPLSRAFLGERHDRWAWISAALAVLGIALVSW